MRQSRTLHKIPCTESKASHSPAQQSSTAELAVSSTSKPNQCLLGYDQVGLRQVDATRLAVVVYESSNSVVRVIGQGDMHKKRFE